jgi:hypothetical protein
MKRRLQVAIGIALVAFAVVVWQCRSRSQPSSDAPGSGSTGSGIGTASQRIDPRTLPRGSIAGTIRDDRGAPIAKARVCTSFDAPALSSQQTRDPICVLADDRGAYRLDKLLAARYFVDAMAPKYTPASSGEAGIRLAPGEARTGVDLVLGRGGVEVAGTVVDVSGGPIGHAHVWGQSAGSATYFAETDDQGKFSLWLKAGRATFYAVADGYAMVREDGQAPDTIELQLTPESSIAGIVVDATTGEPRAGVGVDAVSLEMSRYTQNGSDITDESGHFKISRLLPSRFTLAVRSESGYGRSEGSVLVGLGQQVDGVVIKLHRAYRLSGKIVVAGTKQPCDKASLSITRDAASGSVDGSARAIDDMLVIDGVLPGVYHVRVRCNGYYFDGEPPAVTIKDADVGGLVWEVIPGGKIHGHVRTKAGAVAAGASVYTRPTTPLPRGSDSISSSTTDDAGEFTISGLHTARYRLDVSTHAGVAPDALDVPVTTGATTERDIILEEGGTIIGTVVDGRGVPMPHLEVRAGPLKSGFTRDPDGATTAPDGSFKIEGVSPGDYRVYAVRGWSSELRKPGTTADDVQGERVHVDIGGASTVKIVVEEETGVIRGSVVDSDGKPIGDAYVLSARESDAGGATGNAAGETYWNFDAHPVLTNPDGTFELKRLAAGKYTVRAFRKGGGDAIAEHVATGATARLEIKLTASIEGTVKLRTGPPPDDFAVTVRAPALGLTRTERLFRTDGRYAVRDLPAGSFNVVVEARTGRGSLAVTLSVGEHETGADVTLEPLVALTGTLVELGTHTPIPDVRMFAQPQKGSIGSISFGNEVTPNMTDAAGRFVIESAPVGAIVLIGMPREVLVNWRVNLGRTVVATASGSVDLGELGVVRPRIKTGEHAGRLGVRFKQGNEGEWFDERHEVAWIDPKGPAAKSGLVVGDVVVSVDGIDVTGGNTGRFDPLIEAPPGTSIALGLARNATVKIVLASP